MSEEDFACDKFTAQKWRADMCRHCYQPLRLHAKKQAKQGSSGSSNESSSDAKGNGLTDSLGSASRVAGGNPKARQAVQRGSSPSTHKVKEEQKADDWMSRSVGYSSSPAPSTPTEKSPILNSTATSNQRVSAKSDTNSDFSKSTGVTAQPSTVLSKTNMSSKPTNISKPLASFSSLPSKPPPPAKASADKRNSLPRTSPTVAVKPQDISRTASNKPEALSTPSPNKSENSSVSPTSLEKKQQTPEREAEEVGTSSFVAEQQKEPSPPVILPVPGDKAPETEEADLKSPTQQEESVSTDTSCNMPSTVEQVAASDTNGGESVEDAEKAQNVENGAPENEVLEEESTVLVKEDGECNSMTGGAAVDHESVMEAVTDPSVEECSSELANGGEATAEGASEGDAVVNEVGVDQDAGPTRETEVENEPRKTPEKEIETTVESVKDGIENEDHEGVGGEDVVEKLVPANEGVVEITPTSALEPEKTGEPQEVGMVVEPVPQMDVVDDTVPQEDVPPVDQSNTDSQDIPQPSSEEVTTNSEDRNSLPSNEEPGSEELVEPAEDIPPPPLLSSEEPFPEPAEDHVIPPPISITEEEVTVQATEEVLPSPSLPPSKEPLPEPAEDHVIPPPISITEEEVTVQATEEVLPSPSLPPSKEEMDDIPLSPSLPTREAQESQESQATDEEIPPPSPLPLSEEPASQPPEDILPPPNDIPSSEEQIPQGTEDVIPPPLLPPGADTPAATPHLPVLQAEDISAPTLPPPTSSSDDLEAAESETAPPPPPPPPPLPSPPPDGGELESSAEHIPVPIPPPILFSGASPPPPPPPPPIQPPKAAWNASPKPKRAEAAAAPAAPSAHAAAMSLIKEGGVSLRKVTQPVERPVGEEKVVDFASEMRQKLKKRNKEEAKSVASEVEEKREQVKKVSEMLRGACSTRSYVHQLQSLAAKVEELLLSVGFSEEVLHKYLQWPTHLVAALRHMLELMQQVEEKVVVLEKLSQQLVSSNKPVLTGAGTPSVGVVPSVQLDPDTVDRAITGLLAIAGKVRDVSQLHQSFPVFEHDLERPLHRGCQAILPVMDLLYQKAFNTYDSIHHPSVSKFDKKFRIQNAIRLLRTCGLLSDGLCTQLNIPKHQDYSHAQLKKHELQEKFKDDKEGDWDVDESVQLVKSGSTATRRPGAMSGDSLCERVVASLKKEEGLSEELKEALTPETFAKIEKTFVKAVLSKGDDKLVEVAIALTREVYSGDEVSSHRSDYDWLFDLVVKGKHDRIRHLVTACDVNMNAQSSDVGNSALHRAVGRKDMVTVAVLIRLGANPLLVNGRQHTPVQQLSVKCYPPVSPAANTTEKDPSFSLSSYINSPSLSDVVLISEDGKHFHGHRLVLCAQSPVFKTMLDSDLWAESKNKEMPLPTISGRVLEVLLNYLYTGRCLFPRDDLNLGLDLLAAADLFLLLELKQLCQQMLSEKIDAEVAIPLYYAAVRYSCTHLLASSANFVCAHYNDVEDPNHEALLHLLDNTPPQSL